MDSELIIFEKKDLPANPNDLQKFVILGTEKLNILASQIKLINNLEFAKKLKIQKQEEMVRIANIIILAEIKIKEFLKEKESFGKTKKEKSKIYFNELKKLNISLHENNIMTRLYNFKFEINEIIEKIVNEEKVPTPKMIYNRMRKNGRNKQYKTRTISPDRLKYIEFAIDCLQNYRKQFKSDISKQHKIYCAIQVLEKIIYK